MVMPSRRRSKEHQASNEELHCSISAEIKIQPFAPHHTPLNQANLRSAWLGFFVKKI
jgi:hypothetical protein